MAGPEGPIHVNVQLLRQGIAALELIGGERYAMRPADGESTIGMHFRHVLDHYQAFLAGVAHGGAKIDYDARERDHAVESSVATARSRAEALVSQLEALAPGRLDAPVTVNASTSSDPACAPEWTSTTARRELAFLVSHTVHHYALISHLARTFDVRLPEAFGVAPSTLAYRQLTA